MSRVSVSDPCHRCGHRYSEHGAAHDTQCFCDQFIAAPDFEDKMLTTVENIEEQLKRLNATMERFEPFLAANKPTVRLCATCNKPWHYSHWCASGPLVLSGFISLPCSCTWRYACGDTLGIAALSPRVLFS